MGNWVFNINCAVGSLKQVFNSASDDTQCVKVFTKDSNLYRSGNGCALLKVFYLISASANEANFLRNSSININLRFGEVFSSS